MHIILGAYHLQLLYVEDMSLHYHMSTNRHLPKDEIFVSTILKEKCWISSKILWEVIREKNPNVNLTFHFIYKFVNRPTLGPYSGPD